MGQASTTMSTMSKEETRKAEMFPGSSEGTTTRKLEEHAVNLRKKDRNEIIQGRRKL
jgi:hypothetical protein